MEWISVNASRISD